MMKVRLSDIVNSVVALNTLLSQPVTAKLAYDLGRIARKVEPERAAYEAARVEALRRLGKPNPDEPNQYQFEGDAGEQFVQELNELLGTEIELDIRPVPLSRLDGLTLSGADAANLGWLIVEDSGE